MNIPVPQNLGEGGGVAISWLYENLWGSQALCPVEFLMPNKRAVVRELSTAM